MPPPVTPVNQPRAGPNIGRRSGPLFGDLLGMNGWLWNHNDYIVLKVSLSAAASSSVDDKRTLAIWKKASYWVYILNPVESYQLLLCYNITKLPNISVSSRLSWVPLFNFIKVIPQGPQRHTADVGTRRLCR